MYKYHALVTWILINKVICLKRAARFCDWLNRKHTLPPFPPPPCNHRHNSNTSKLSAAKIIKLQGTLYHVSFQGTKQDQTHALYLFYSLAVLMASLPPSNPILNNHSNFKNTDPFSSHNCLLPAHSISILPLWSYVHECTAYTCEISDVSAQCAVAAGKSACLDYKLIWDRGQMFVQCLAEWSTDPWLRPLRATAVQIIKCGKGKACLTVLCSNWSNMSRFWACTRANPLGCAAILDFLYTLDAIFGFHPGTLLAGAEMKKPKTGQS